MARGKPLSSTRPPRKSNGRAAKRTEGDAPTRVRVIEATVDAITELGYYNATSNEIARRAGVTWGVIQYYFGSREGLLVAVVEDACDEMLGDLQKTEITGESVAERLASWVEAIHGFFSKPGYVAILQIMWDVLSRPTTQPEANKALVRYQDELMRSLRDLVPQIADGISDELVDLMFAGTWGLALADASAKTFSVLNRENRSIPLGTFVEAMAWLIEREQDGGGRRTAGRTRPRSRRA